MVRIWFLFPRRLGQQAAPVRLEATWKSQNQATVSWNLRHAPPHAGSLAEDGLISKWWTRGPGEGIDYPFPRFTGGGSL